LTLGRQKHPLETHISKFKIQNVGAIQQQLNNKSTDEKKHKQ
jgi:hypothetical protein